MSNVLGFSCVENHVLDEMKNRCENIGLLYFDCFMSLNDIYVCSCESSFEYFSGVHRIQDILKENGMLKIELYRNSFDDFIKIIEKNNTDTIVLMLLNKEETKKMFFARGLREDHYVLAGLVNDGYYLSNDIPSKKILVDKSKLKQLYIPNYLVFEFLPFYEKTSLQNLCSQRKYFFKNNPSNLDLSIIHKENFLITFRNALVIYKTMRERMHEYLSALSYDIDLSDEISEISKAIAYAEYMRLRKVCDIEKYNELVLKANKIERKIFNKVVERYGTGNK